VPAIPNGTASAAAAATQARARPGFTGRVTASPPVAARRSSDDGLVDRPQKPALTSHEHHPEN